MMNDGVDIKVEPLAPGITSCKLVVNVEDRLYVELPVKYPRAAYLVEEALKRMGPDEIHKFLEDYDNFAGPV